MRMIGCGDQLHLLRTIVSMRMHERCVAGKEPFVLAVLHMLFSG